MNRFEDSPDLFGSGSGVSTTASIHCDWCGGSYEDESDIASVCWTMFGGKQICDCCFGIIEGAVIRRMDAILPWYTRILKSKRLTLEIHEKALEITRNTLESEVKK